jgi:PAT family beta-lactamase induction signal transducer AmpG
LSVYSQHVEEVTQTAPSAKQPDGRIYVSSLYFAQGIPYAMVIGTSSVILKSLGADNILIGQTALLHLPWVLKFAWAPFVDYFGTKRNWIVITEILLGCLCFIAGLFCTTAFAIPLVIAAFAIMAMAAATHDIAEDGFYFDALTANQQTYFVGLRCAAVRLSWLFGQGVLVYIAGVTARMVSLQMGWLAALGIAGTIMLGCAMLHHYYLPKPPKPEVVGANTLGFQGPDFRRAARTFFGQSGIPQFLTYISLFRLGEAMLLKQAQPFLLDAASKGGLALSVEQVGIIYGAVGTGALILGGFLGAYLVNRDGLTKWLVPAAIIQNMAMLSYFVLASNPEYVTAGNVWCVYLANWIEQFAYGIGVSAFIVVVLSTVGSEYKAAHYAFATAFMAAGLMVPGIFSGYLQQALGYPMFFLACFFASIPGMISIAFLPIWKKEPESGLLMILVLSLAHREIDAHYFRHMQ